MVKNKNSINHHDLLQIFDVYFRGFFQTPKDIADLNLSINHALVHMDTKSGFSDTVFGTVQLLSHAISIKFTYLVDTETRDDIFNPSSIIEPFDSEEKVLNLSEELSSLLIKINDTALCCDTKPLIVLQSVLTYTLIDFTKNFNNLNTKQNVTL